MSTNTGNRNESPSQREGARACSSSEVLAILAPAADEPQPIQRMGVWKTGPEAVPATGSAA